MNASRTVSLHTAVTEIAAAVEANGAPSDGPQIVAIDGRAGAGKTTLAGPLAAALGAQLVRLDDLYAGWNGLREGITVLVDSVLAPLAAGGVASPPTYDWGAQTYRPGEPLQIGTRLVIEGVGAGSLLAAPFLNCLVVVTADQSVREARALARTSDPFDGHWDTWARVEDEYFATDAPRERANFVYELAAIVPGSGSL